MLVIRQGLCYRNGPRMDDHGRKSFKSMFLVYLSVSICDKNTRLFTVEGYAMPAGYSVNVEM